MSQEDDTLALAHWSTKDKDWLDKHVPKELQHIALRYGRSVYTLVMHIGAAQYALNVLVQNMKRKQESLRAVLVLQGVLNDLIKQAAGADVEKVHQCKGDIETIAALSNGTVGSRVSPSGIILDS